MTLNDINFQLAKRKGLLKEMKEAELPQVSLDGVQKIIDDLELKKQAATPPHARLADLDKGINDLKWYKEKEEYKIEKAFQQIAQAQDTVLEAREQIVILNEKK